MDDDEEGIIFILEFAAVAPNPEAETGECRSSDLPPEVPRIGPTGWLCLRRCAFVWSMLSGTTTTTTAEVTSGGTS